MGVPCKASLGVFGKQASAWTLEQLVKDTASVSLAQLVLSWVPA